MPATLPPSAVAAAVVDSTRGREERSPGEIEVVAVMVM